MKVTVIIPTINEGKSIGKVIDDIIVDCEKEVIIVDSNSTDGTVEISRSKGAVVINEPRKGYGRAYKTGIESASGDVIATLDGDSTYPAEEIGKLVKMLDDEKLDFITCDRLSKMQQGAMSGKHKFGNWVLSMTMRILFGTRIKDSQSGMWIFRRKIVEKLELTSDGMPFSEEIKIEACRKGFKVKEVPIEYRVRVGEAKLTSWGDGTKNLKFLFRKKFGKAKHESEPIKLKSVIVEEAKH